MTVGERIRSYRENAKMSQNDMAKMFHVSRPTVTKWEADKQELKASEIMKLADFFNITTDELLLGVKPENRTLVQELGLSSATIDNLKQVQAIVNDFNDKENKRLGYSVEDFSLEANDYSLPCKITNSATGSEYPVLIHVVPNKESSTVPILSKAIKCLNLIFEESRPDGWLLLFDSLYDCLYFKDDSNVVVSIKKPGSGTREQVLTVPLYKRNREGKSLSIGVLNANNEAVYADEMSLLNIFKSAQKELVFRCIDSIRDQITYNIMFGRQ